MDTASLLREADGWGPTGRGQVLGSTLQHLLERQSERERPARWRQVELSLGQWVDAQPALHSGSLQPPLRCEGTTPCLCCVCHPWALGLFPLWYLPDTEELKKRGGMFSVEAHPPQAGLP